MTVFSYSRVFVFEKYKIRLRGRKNINNGSDSFSVNDCGREKERERKQNKAFANAELMKITRRHATCKVATSPHIRMAQSQKWEKNDYRFQAFSDF